MTIGNPHPALRPLMMGALAAALLISAACTGQTASGGTPQCANGCYGVVIWRPTNTTFTGTPQGVGSDIYVRDLTCDANCVSENGYIANYIMLASADLKVWYELGFWRSGQTNGSLQYFSATNNVQGNVQFTNYGSGPSLYNYTLFGVDHAVDTSGNYIAAIAADPHGGWSTASFYFLNKGAVAFTPGAIEMGELLHGTHGEAAEDSDWLGNRYENQPIYAYPLSSMYPYLLTNSSHGAIVSQNPPYANWMNVIIDGDTFTAQCCTP